MKIKILKVFLSLLLLGCLLDMPYGYFQLVRFSSMVIFTILFFNEKNSSLKIFWIISAILVNPFFKLSLGRFIWNCVDIIWAIILIVSIFYHDKLISNEKKNGL